MKRWLLAAALVLLLFILPHPGTELGELHPVSLLLVELEGREIRLETDTHMIGRGETLDAALRNLESTTPGYLFLDTAENLVLRSSTLFLLPELSQCLRPNVGVCVAEGPLQLDALPVFLKIHPPGLPLSGAVDEKSIPILYETEGGYLLENGKNL